MKQTAKITLDQIDAAICQLDRACPDGFTVDELAEQLHVASTTARKRLSKLVAAGMARHVGKKPCVHMNGTRGWIDVYQLVTQ